MQNMQKLAPYENFPLYGTTQPWYNIYTTVTYIYIYVVQLHWYMYHGWEVISREVVVVYSWLQYTQLAVTTTYFICKS